MEDRSNCGKIFRLNKLYSKIPCHHHYVTTSLLKNTKIIIIQQTTQTRARFISLRWPGHGEETSCRGRRGQRSVTIRGPTMTRRRHRACSRAQWRRV